MIKKLGEYLPAISVFVILVGILKLNVYYQNFHVPIKYYFGFSEIGVFIAQDFFSVILTLSAFIFISLNDAITLQEKASETNSDIKKKKESQLKNEKKVNPYFVGIILLIFIVGVLMNIFYFKKYSDRIVSVSWL